MFKTIAIIIVVLLAGVLTYAATKPDNFRVERSISANAPPEKIAALISDFHLWSGWSPYENKDPQMKRTFSGAQNGTGAVYEWNGNSEVGQGRMEITESSPSKIAIKLDFIKPFEGYNVATFTLAPQGDATIVTWAMDGPSPYVAKVIGVFCNMDHMIGKDFETGLANLKTAVEKQG